MFSMRAVFVAITLYANIVLSGFLVPLTITLERSKVTCDGIVIVYCNSTVRKYNRTSSYLMNVYAKLEKPMTKNVTVIFKSYEWKDNQYKESFLGFNKNLCDFLERDPLMAAAVKNFPGIPKKCPFKVGEFILKDFVISETIFPPGFPISKWKFTFFFRHVNTNHNVGSFEIEFKVNEAVKRKG